MNSRHKATQCVHAGNIYDEKHGGVVSPVYLSSAFDYRDMDTKAYPRYFNTPNQLAVAQKLAALENGEKAMVFSSGMAAISTVLFAMLTKDDHALFQNDLYGGTHHAIATELEKYGIEYDFIDSLNPDDFRSKVKANTRLIYIETPSNPLLKIIDIEDIAKLAKEKALVSVIDNTFASPINQNPIAHGIDIVVHSGTKYLCGHSDICCGAVVSSEKIMEQVGNTAINFGGSLNARDCSLLERSLKTLAIRVERQNSNALGIAEFLQSHKEVIKVHYPGLPDHSGHERAKGQMAGFGGMLSFEVKWGAEDFVKRLKLISAAMSLGGVESTISSPALTSHAKMSPKARAQAGISDGLLRLSVGIEEVEDLIADIKSALDFSSSANILPKS